VSGTLTCPGRGRRFSVREAETSGCPETAEERTEGPSPLDVLVVEDNPADIALVRRAVAKCSPAIRLSVLSNGREVLPFLRHAGALAAVPTPALILLDLSLPGCDGHDILAQLHGGPESQHTPVVVLSGSARALEESRCLALGASAYVEKSSHFRDYCGSIQVIVRHWLGVVCPPP
jgi:chemotaxis family two-component system response regulator Rcp1